MLSIKLYWQEALEGSHLPAFQIQVYTYDATAAGMEKEQLGYVNEVILLKSVLIFLTCTHWQQVMSAYGSH